ncbi:hypothetical protein FRC01_008228, partial [Tulasnella sp. 417]
MQPSIQDHWSPRSSDRSSHPTSATSSEAGYSDDADDELTTSENMSSMVTSDVASGLEGLRSRTPTRSDAASVYSYSSSMHHLTREIYGRVFNNVND